MYFVLVDGILFVYNKKVPLNPNPNPNLDPDPHLILFSGRVEQDSILFLYITLHLKQFKYFYHDWIKDLDEDRMGIRTKFHWFGFLHFLVLL